MAKSNEIIARGQEVHALDDGMHTIRTANIESYLRIIEGEKALMASHEAVDKAWAIL